VLVNDRQRDLEALALAIARRLVQREVVADPALLPAWITRALALLPHDLTVDVRVHPAELEAMAAVRGTLLPADSGVTLHWIADPEVGRAGFVVESPQRLVDGRLDVALRSLYERLEQE
jgi:flagellar biosynthesis/type III secretory pathway protein FliH